MDDNKIKLIDLILVKLDSIEIKGTKNLQAMLESIEHLCVLRAALEEDDHADG